MSLVIRPMRAEDAPGVVAMVHGLARDTAPDVTPQLKPENLIDNDDLIQVTIAEDGNGILGACLTLLTFSTWRGLKGLYVVDLFIDGKFVPAVSGKTFLTTNPANGEVVGKFMTYFPARREFTAHDRDCAVGIARQVGFSLERYRTGIARQSAETRLRESEERFRHMVEDAPIMIWVSEKSGHCLHINPLLRDFWGVEDIATFDWSKTLHPEDRERIVREPSIIPSAVEELLRLDGGAKTVSRITSRTVTIGETTIPAGSHVELYVGFVHRDEAAEPLGYSAEFEKGGHDSHLLRRL